MMGRHEPLDEQVAQLQAMYLEGGIDGVALVAWDATACPACLEVADRVYMPVQLPAVPVEGCIRPGGCRCRYEPSVTVYE